MGFLDRLRGNKNKTEEKTQTKAAPKIKSESEKHDDFVRRLREQNRSTQSQQSSANMANRMNNKKGGSGSSGDEQQERERKIWEERNRQQQNAKKKGEDRER